MPAADALQGGKIVWHASIIPADTQPAPSLPATSTDALWNFARQVDAAFVQTHDPRKNWATETERYLFYRGLGTAPLPVRFSYDSGGTIASDRDKNVEVRHVFTIRVENGKAAYAYRPDLKPGEEVRNVIPAMDGAGPVERVAEALADDLAKRLEESGLYAKEARAMVNTWKSSYFKTEGVRALFVLPRSWTEEFIPMALNPKPRELVRVMVGRLELLTPERERLAEAAVADLASPDSGRRMAAFETLQKQGRYVEPIVRRVLKTSKDERVKLLCRKLLKTEFVTELRAAVRSLPDPAAPKQPSGDPNQLQKESLDAMMAPTENLNLVRAQLAILLRSVGLDDEAKAEGKRALAVLDPARVIPPDTCAEGQAAKFAARAYEGMGDDRVALTKYGRLIDLAALTLTRADCRKCHAEGDWVPTRLAQFRGWWPGDGYARSAERLGELETTTASLKATADNQGSTPAPIGVKLKLAYLAEAQGRHEEADAIWAKIEGDPPTVAASGR
jgi:tetratricopeptide (TPR) repeat protein